MPKPKNVLLVEDDVSLLELWAHTITTAGHHVMACVTFEEAKQHLDRSTPDILVTDIRLGPFNGLQLVLLAKAVNPDVLTIVLTGYDDPVMRVEAERAGARFLLKPVTAEQLTTLLEHA